MAELADALRGNDDPFQRVIYTESHDEVAEGQPPRARRGRRW